MTGASIDTTRAGLVRALSDIQSFSQAVVGTPLRPYQTDPARAILRSIDERLGHTITVLMPRQAGKNHLAAMIESYLLVRHQLTGGSIVKAAPTFKPQLLTSIRRLRQMLDNPLTRRTWRSERGYILNLGHASITFFSAEPWANVVGATASLLLECDEAQDVNPEKWSKDFIPMAATGFATRVLYGTPWTNDTLLEQQIALNREAEARDGIQRHFQTSWEDVATTNPDYGRHVRAEIARLGEHHPIIRTQYLLQALAGQGRFLDATQLELLRGDHQPQTRPEPRGPGSYIAGIDVAGQDEEDPNTLLTTVTPHRDSTVLLIGFAEREQVDQSVIEPKVRIVALYAWRGTPHRLLYPQILELLRHWRVSSAVVDATGVGGGLTTFLLTALGPRVVTPYVYTAASKSKLAYDFLAAVGAGRLKVHQPTDTTGQLVGEFFHQCAAAEYAMRAHQMMTFFVPTSRGHDDLLNAAALLVQAAPLGQLRTATASRPGRGHEDGPGVVQDRQTRPSRR